MSCIGKPIPASPHLAEAFECARVFARQCKTDAFVVYRHGTKKFSVRTEPAKNRSIRNCYRVTAEGLAETYPGLPNLAGEVVRVL